MNLASTGLPDEFVLALRGLNIREAEALLSMLESPVGMMAISRVLRISVDAVRELGSGLKLKFPNLDVVPVASSPSAPDGASCIGCWEIASDDESASLQQANE